MACNKSCTTCNTILDKDNYKIHRSVCKNCYKKRKKSKNISLIQNQQPKIDTVNNNNRSTLLVRPSLPGKTYLMLKILSPTPNRDNYIITKSPLEQYSTKN